MDDPIHAVGSVRVLRAGGWRHGGTCFAYGRPDHVLTAAHCVEALEPHEVGIAFLASPGRLAPIAIVRHPTADLALLQLGAGSAPAEVEPFAETRHASECGRALAGIGTQAGAAEPGAAAVVRRFEGRLRRVFVDAADGHRYADISVAARDGFSGGPLFARAAPHPVIGLITGNRSRPLTLGGLHRRLGPWLRQPPADHAAGRGIVLLLGELSQWLDAHAAPAHATP